MSHALLSTMEGIKKPKAAAAATQDAGDKRLRLAVIGAGAAGLVSAKHAVARPEVFNVTVFEQNDRLGGTWIYTERSTEDDQRSVHSSMYKSLKTNLPKQTMAFMDHPFPQSARSFLSRKDVLDYLEDYANHFHVTSSIQFNKRVVYVCPFPNGYRPGWLVDVEDTKGKEKTRHVFDAVMTCNGHFSEPRYPEIPGIENFIGFVMHSHSYRIPEPFRGLKVVCLGAGSSGIDISVEIASVAEMVYLSHNKRKPFITDEIPPNLIEIDGIVGANATGFLTSSGDWYEANALVLCTGYLYAFSFLSPECQIEVSDNRVSPLYKHMINIAHPTMALVGLPLRSCPFKTFDLQAQYFLATLAGDVVLPSREEMVAQTEKELQALVKTGKSVKYAHNLADKQWAYFAELAEAVGTTPPPRVVQNIFKHVYQQRRLYPYSYRTFEYVVLDDEEFMELGSSDGLKG